MKKMLCLFLVLFLGCAGNPARHDSTPVTGEAIVKGQTLVQEARKNVVAATPHADATGKNYLSTADDQLGGADDELTSARKSLADIRQQIGTLQDKSIKQQTQIDQYRQRWFGDRFFAVVRWLCGIAAVGVGLIGFGLMGTSPVFTIAAYAGRAILSILNPLAAVTWAADHIWLRKTSTSQSS